MFEIYIFHRSSERIRDGTWRLPFNLGNVSGMYLLKCILSRMKCYKIHIVLFTTFLDVGRLSSREQFMSDRPYENQNAVFDSRYARIITYSKKKEP